MVFGGAPAPNSANSVLQAQYFDVFMPNAGQAFGATNPYSAAIQTAMLAANPDVSMIGYILNGGIVTKRVGQTDPADPSFTYPYDLYVRSAMIWNTGGSVDTGDPTRSPLNTPYVVGDYVIPSSGWDGVTYWRCTVQGTPGGSEPSWPATPTPEVTTQTDGTVTWICTRQPPSVNGCTVLTSTGGGTANAAVKVWDPRWKAELAAIIGLRWSFTSGATPMAVMDGMLSDIMGLAPPRSMNTPGYNPFTKNHYWREPEWQTVITDLLATGQSACMALGIQFGGNALNDGIDYYGANPTKKSLSVSSFGYSQEWLRVDANAPTVLPTESEWRCDVNMLIDENMNQHPLFIATALWPLAATDVTNSKRWHKFSYASFGLANDGLHQFQFRDDNVHFTYGSTPAGGATATMTGRQSQYAANYYFSTDGFNWWDNVAAIGTPTDFWRSSAVVSGATAVGAVATYTTSLQHGYQVGDQVQVAGVSPAAYNTPGSTVTAAPSTTTFKMTLNSSPGSFVSAGTSTGPGAGRARAITGVPTTAKTALYTTATAHGLSVGNTVTISGITPSGWNLGPLTVTATPSLTQFGVALAGSPTAYVSGGTVTGGSNASVSGAAVNFLVSVTTAAVHNFNLMDPVSITGFDFLVANTSIQSSGMNTGGYVSSIPSSTQFTYLMTFNPTPPTASVSNGSAIAQGQVGDHIALAQQAAGHYIRKYTGGVLAVNPTPNDITNATITGLLASHTYTDIDNTTYVTSGAGVLTIASMGKGTGYLLRA